MIRTKKETIDIKTLGFILPLNNPLIDSPDMIAEKSDNIIFSTYYLNKFHTFIDNIQQNSNSFEFIRTHDLTAFEIMNAYLRQWNQDRLDTKLKDYSFIEYIETDLISFQKAFLLSLAEFKNITIIATIEDDIQTDYYIMDNQNLIFNMSYVELISHIQSSHSNF